MTLTLIIGNKNYSSWSMRPWIAMKVAGIAFDEKVIPLYEPGSREQVLQHSPAGKVPALVDRGDQRVWESLAILEYLAEKFPYAKLWPDDARARAHARVVATEMHGGFQALRKNCPMNLWLPVKSRPLQDTTPWRMSGGSLRCGPIAAFASGKEGHSCSAHSGQPMQCMSPIVARLHTYGVDVDGVTRGYMEAIMALPAWNEWRQAALKEPWIMKGNEPDWPLVRGVALS